MRNNKARAEPYLDVLSRPLVERAVSPAYS